MSRHLTNKELMADEKISTAVKSGKLVVIDKVETSNPEYINMYFMGLVEGLSPEKEVSSLAASLLGWDNSGFPLRAIQNASVEIAAKFEIGNTIEGRIVVEDHLESQYGGQKARQDKDGNMLYHHGKAVYRLTSIIGNEEFEGHRILEASKAEEVASPQPSEPPIGSKKSSLLS
jgi:hypothetical protein